MIRSLLFLPCNNPNMLINAAFLGADAIILDLEDAVSPDEKDAARILARNTLRYMDLKGKEKIVRINSIDTEFCKADIAAVLPEKPDMLLVPKTNFAADVLAVDEYLTELEKKLGIPAYSTGIMALIETAVGVENAYSISSCSPRVKALLLGAEDLTADLRCERTKGGKEIEYSRSRVVVAARAAGLEVYDTPFTDVNDDQGIIADCLIAKGFGFTGKASISPRHIEVINETFSPSESEIDYAYQVIDAISVAKENGKGAVALRGKMIDAPIVARAERVIAMAKILGKGKKEDDE